MIFSATLCFTTATTTAINSTRLVKSTFKQDAIPDR
jgi:hypothetical protein